MKIHVALLKAFGVDETGGNPAGVILDADLLTDNQKKYIAKRWVFRRPYMWKSLTKLIIK